MESVPIQYISLAILIANVIQIIIFARKNKTNINKKYGIKRKRYQRKK